MSRTRSELETILRYDQAERRLHLFTTFARDARRWQRAGFPVQVTSRDRGGRPQGWRAVVPLACLRPLRPLETDGSVRRRRKTGGRGFGAAMDGASEDRTTPRPT